MDKHLDAEALSDYAEGLPDAQARAAAEAHLAGCARCRGELAAVQAYFRGLADLEPARAPADFLAKVRARLPRPSPWERAWAALLLPFRSVPLPIAVAVIMGVTAITVYMRQGGPGSRREVPAPAGPESASGSASDSHSAISSGQDSEPAAPASAPAASVEGRNPASGSQPSLKGIDPEIVGSAAAAPAAADRAAAARRQKSVSRASHAPSEDAGLPEAPVASPAPSPTPQAVPAPSALGRSPSVPPASAPMATGAGPADTKDLPAKPVPARPRGASPDRSGKLRDVDAIGWLDNPSPVYMMDHSGPAANLPLDKTMPLEEKEAVPGQAEAAASHAAGRREEKAKGREEVAAKKAEGGAPFPPEATAAPARAPAPGYALSLRAKSDTAAVLAGLRSMGVEAESEYASSGESRYRLRVPAPMLRELGPYLARHGESRAEGQLPSAASGSDLNLRLRLLFPAH